MAVIPLKQSVIVTRKEGDEWDDNLVETSFEMKCRFQEGTKLVRSMSGSNGAQNTTASEVVSTADIYFDKLADIQLTDTLEYTNELGITRTYTPLTIEIKRSISGKPILTVVSV